jgi:hypothetical protein
VFSFQKLGLAVFGCQVCIDFLLGIAFGGTGASSTRNKGLPRSQTAGFVFQVREPMKPKFLAAGS